MQLEAGTDFFENGLCFYCHLAKRDLHEYLEFHSETELSWAAKDTKLQDDISSILERYDSSEHGDIVESHGWELHLNQTRYPDIHRTALVVALFMFVEEQLNGLCQTIYESIDTNVSLSDMRGRGTQRALRYLSKVAEFDLGLLPSLSFVRHAQLLRNRLVHAGGILPSGKHDKLNQFVSDQSGLRGDPGHRVRVAPSFINELAEHFDALFDQLDRQVQQFMGRFST